MVMNADTDGDGFVTGNEFILMLRSSSNGEQTDRGQSDPRRPDGDRADQMQRMFGPGRRPGADQVDFLARMFEARDGDKDGKLTGDEIPEPLAGRMEQVDSDGDKSVSREELKAMAMRMNMGDGGRPARQGDRGADEGGRRPGGDLPRRPDAEE